MRQFYHMKLIWIAALAAAAVTIMGAAHAQDDPVYLAEYKAYNQAMNASDREAAERHGLAAWQAAEEALGDNQLTGILAFNYGQLVIFTDPKAARSALRRAKKLQNDGVVELPETDLNLFLAYAEFAVSDGRWRQANQLRNALIAIEEKGAPTNSDIATMWYKLAFSDFSRKRYKHAIESASKAEAAFLVSSPENYRQRANAILIGGAARLLPFPLTVDNTQAAHNEFSRAQNLFPPQKDLDSFDPLLAQILGWDAAADAVLGSLSEKDYPDHENIDRNDPTQYYSPIFEQEEKSDEECGVEWDRDPPKYPSQAGWKGHIGAVIIGYNLGDDTLVHDARILTEIPAKIFGDAVLKNMETWRLAAPISNDPACRQNRITHFTFMMSD